MILTILLNDEVQLVDWSVCSEVAWQNRLFVLSVPLGKGWDGVNRLIDLEVCILLDLLHLVAYSISSLNNYKLITVNFYW